MQNLTNWLAILNAKPSATRATAMKWKLPPMGKKYEMALTVTVVLFFVLFMGYMIPPARIVKP